MGHARVVEVFSDLSDPRVERTRAHRLVDILVVAVLAVICGADGWDEIAAYGRLREKWLRTFLELPHGIPSADTIRRVFERIDPAAFSECFARLVSSLSGSLVDKVIAIDGKTARRSFTGKHEGPLHLVSAWCVEQGITLGQVATDAKSNEITAIPALLALIDVKGATITIDAMGCQKAIAAAIVEKKADYILAVKENQPTLRTEVEAVFTDMREDGFEPVPFDEHVTVDDAHGRRERRRIRIWKDVSWMTNFAAWPGLRSIAEVERTRTVRDQTSVERSYYISSLNVDADTFGRRVRAHWGIENSLHWVLDVVFHEDRSRIHDRRGAANFALLRKLAIGLIRAETKCHPKMSGAMKRKAAMWDPTYVIDVIASVAGT